MLQTYYILCLLPLSLTAPIPDNTVQTRDRYDDYVVATYCSAINKLYNDCSLQVWQLI